MKNFWKWWRHSGGDTSYLENPEKFQRATFRMPVYAQDSGYIQTIDADMVGSIARYLGAGRMNDEKELDKAAGIVLNKKIGEKVEAGEIVAYIHTNEESKVIGSTKNLEDAFKISKRKITTLPRIIEVM